MITLWLWLGFLALLTALVALDVGVLSRRPREITQGEAALSLGLWLAAAGICSLVLLALLQADALGAAAAFDKVLTPPEAAKLAWAQFVTVYTNELALSIDNIAVISIIFAHFQVRPAIRARVLFRLVIACLLFRAVCIFAGAELLQLPGVHYGLAGLLVLATLRELWLPDQHDQLGKRLLMRALRRLPAPPPRRRRPSTRQPPPPPRLPPRSPPTTATASSSTMAADGGSPP